MICEKKNLTLAFFGRGAWCLSKGHSGVSNVLVPILPNFAMTDYASQGKTRPDNVVDLTNSTLHQSYYTALSRSGTSSGTVIVQSFSPGPITGGASGWLRQEFHELELLCR